MASETYRNFHGVKGRSGRWSKRKEWEWNDLVDLSKAELMKLGKRYQKMAASEINPKDKLYKFWLEVSLAIVLKSMPAQKAVELETETPEQLPFVVRINGVSHTGN